MGFFTDLFGRKESKKDEKSLDASDLQMYTEQETEVQIDQTAVQEVMKLLKEETKRDCLEIKLNLDAVGLFESKLGGLPYLPKGGDVPSNEEGQQLRLLAQISLSELPVNEVGLSGKGMLQFWVLDDDLTGLETDTSKMVGAKGHAVTYYETIDRTVTEEEIREKYHPYCEDESYFPVQDVFGMEFELVQEGISTSDCQFDQKFAKVWNRLQPEHKINGYFDLDDDDATEYIYNEACGSGHKIGGYPMFTQYDPREGDLEDYQILLLQIDSFGVGGKEIMWGDAGVGNFFITLEDLKRLDFSRVLYSWDCC